MFKPGDKVIVTKPEVLLEPATGVIRFYGPSQLTNEDGTLYKYVHAYITLDSAKVVPGQENKAPRSDLAVSEDDPRRTMLFITTKEGPDAFDGAIKLAE